MFYRAIVFLSGLICICFFPLTSYADEYALLVEKQAHRLSVLRLGDHGQETLITSYRAITGKEQGSKVTRGDQKTPEGIYFVEQTKEKADLYKAYGSLANKYGAKAFVLNYPNIFDNLQGKTGGGIWIHGVASEDRVLNPFDTEGCVALSNLDVVDITKYIEQVKTPIVIVDDLKSKKFHHIFGQTPKYESLLEDWRKAWEIGDYSRYESYYSHSFMNDKKNKTAWMKYKKNIFELNNKNISVKVASPKVIEFNDQLVITFEQKYSSGIKKDVGHKSLYLKKEGERYKIFAEEFYPET